MVVDRFVSVSFSDLENWTLEKIFLANLHNYARIVWRRMTEIGKIIGLHVG